MALKQAHEGYEYQDLLIAYFILKEILNEVDSTFYIDQKLFTEDVFDDLSIKAPNKLYKKQIKYSNSKTAHILSKEDLSANGYNLALDDLFFSWQAIPDRNNCEITLCLSWAQPTDELLTILEPLTNKGSFDEFKTSLYSINIDKFWPQSGPPPSWRKFSNSVNKINRKDFASFLSVIKIEVNFPKFSLDFYNPGELETIFLRQLDRLGIGYYPNNNWKKEEFALSLLAVIKRARSQGLILTTAQLFKEFSIQTDYGSIVQFFPIDKSRNVSPTFFLKSTLKALSENQKITITGEPGSGKSWYAENLKLFAEKKGFRVIRHLCYTDIEDAFQKNRIQLDVFYGNLIKDILIAYPDLKEKKEKRYASDLTELNILLQSISDPTLLIVDGIDHIHRIFKYKNFGNELRAKDVDIIGAINNLILTDHIKIIIITQPIAELNQMSGYKNLIIPRWNEKEVISYLKKNHIPNSTIENGLLSSKLSEKSGGNPLYLKYLVSEINKDPKRNIDQLPQYNHNLTEYYSYILTQLNLKEQVPRILSGVNFSLTKQELKEITGGGLDVEDSLSVMEPIVKSNFSQNGYSIYHESFKRFILEKLVKDEISIEMTVFSPVISWFEKVGFYNHKKAYRHYFPIVYDLNKLEKITDFIKKDFVTESIFHGHQWDYIQNNYRFLVKTALANQDLSQVVLVNEINKIISTTKDEFFENYLGYLETLGLLRGFPYVSDHLVYEGQPTVSLLFGLKVCTLCDSYGHSAPWNLYLKYFEKGKVIELEDFKLYVKSLIFRKNKVELVKLFKKIVSNKANNYLRIYKSELKNNNKNPLVREVLDTIVSIKPKEAKMSENEFIILIKEISGFSRIDDSAVEKIYLLKDHIENYTENHKLFEAIKSSIVNQSWYSNWLLFLIESERLKVKQKVSVNEIEATLEILIYEKEPFKGTLRASDLYRLEDIIYESIKNFVSRMPSNDWGKIFQILKSVSDNLTTSYQKALMGPLPAPSLFKLLFSLKHSIENDSLISFMENMLLEKEGYHLHSYLSEYCFQISNLYSLADNKTKASEYFKRGIQYILGYTGRKDSAIEDLTESILTLNSIDNAEAIVAIKNLKPLIDSVVDHTDGKGTRHFPVEWFKKFIEIDETASLMYLLDNFKNTQYDYQLEESLQRLIEKSSGSISPIVETLITRTFILENDEWLLEATLRINEKHVISELKNQVVTQIYAKAKARNSHGYSEKFLNQLRAALIEYNLYDAHEFNSIEKGNIYDNHDEPETRPHGFSMDELVTMSLKELCNFISENTLTDEEILLLKKRFSEIKVVSDESKKLIDSFFSSKHKYNKRHSEEVLFMDKMDEVAIYYWISRYVKDYDPWFRSLVNFDGLIKAYRIDKSQSLSQLYNCLYSGLSFGFSNLLAANLINGLSKIDFDSNLLKKAYATIYEVIDYRLPSKDKYDWNTALKNDLELTAEQILVCILLLRSKAYTSERFFYVLSGISCLIDFYPEMIVKPLKWFFKNSNLFKQSITCSILQLLFEKSKTDKLLISQIQKDLDNLYPTNYFILDCIIENILNKQKRALILKTPEFINTLADDEYQFYLSHNSRHLKLLSAGLDVRRVFGRIKATYFTEYPEETREIYGNRSVKRVVENIVFSDYLLKRINQDLYEDLYKFTNSRVLLESIKIDAKLLVAQTNSLTVRPKNLLAPSEKKEKASTSKISSTESWIRIAHFEKELAPKSSYHLEEYYCYGALSFGKEVELSINFEELNTSDLDKVESDKVVNFYYQRDFLESYKIIWLNGADLRALNISKDLTWGIVGRDVDGLIVLKYNCWNDSYVGEGIYSRLSEEIPKRSGAELLIRNDYFLKLCKLHKGSPKYLRRDF
jgi:nucleoside-triphosphatase THEP1